MSYSMVEHTLFGSKFLWHALAQFHQYGGIIRLVRRDNSKEAIDVVPRESTTTETSTVSLASATTGPTTPTNSTPTTVTAHHKESTVLHDIVVEIAVGTAVVVLATGMWNVINYLERSLIKVKDDNNMDQVMPGAMKHVNAILRKRGKSLTKTLNHHEQHIAEDIIDPDDIDSCFEDIGGMDDLKQEIWELAILPLKRPELFKGKSKLTMQPPGILLFGRPGCGKTLLAKAIAKEGQAVFIPIKLSKILNKWVGESNKLVAATFSLARSLAPSIIFIDELDTFLSDTVDPSANKSMESLKAEFLTMCDGINTSCHQAPVLVLGATNRPHLIDEAMSRRLSRSFEVPLPNAKGRGQILQVLLLDQPMDQEAEDFLPFLADLTNGYSGSDLKELCRAAAMEPIREIAVEESKKAVMGEREPMAQLISADSIKVSIKMAEMVEPKHRVSADDLRPVNKLDFISALKKVKQTGLAAKEYGRKMAARKAVEEDADHAARKTLDDCFKGFTNEQVHIRSQFISQLKGGEENPNGIRKPDRYNSNKDKHDTGDMPPPTLE